jgi:predicted TIM-barrel fold metal-dependent hydrolase
MIIDGHSHACGNFLTAESIIHTLDSCGVDKVVLVPGELNSKAEYTLPDLAKAFPKRNVVKVTNFMTKIMMKLTNKVKDIPLGNEYVFDLKTKCDNRVIQFVWVTSGMGNVSEYLDEKYHEWEFSGVKLHQCWEYFSINSDFFKEVATWAEKMDLPLFIHLDKDKDVIQLIEYKRKHPNLKLIVAHLFGIEVFVSKNYKDDNLYFDTSTLQLVSDYRLRLAIDFVGAGKILLGTDTPYGAKNNIVKNIERIKRLEISEEEKNMILGLNIKGLLRL